MDINYKDTKYSEEIPTLAAMATIQVVVCFKMNHLVVLALVDLGSTHYTW